MEVFTDIIGNIHDKNFAETIHDYHIETIYLDQWTAQKSRFLATSDHGNEYPVALKRQSQITDGDVVFVDSDKKQAVVLRLKLNPVLEINLDKVKERSPEDIIRISVELGHAIGNQHWPAVVKGTRVFVPLTVDRKVMLSVMETHDIDDITYEFHDGTEVIPYMAPHEIRRLFGGASHDNHHIHGDHEHAHAHIVK